jgi:ketosteroid isomerase-like protein/uncharacterized protein YciI
MCVLVAATRARDGWGMSTPEQINERFRDAFNARDVAGLLALYEPDAVLVLPDAPPRRGLTDIEDALRAFLGLGGTLRFTRRYCLVNGGWAHVSIDWILTDARVDGNPVDMAAGSSELIRRQPDGDWKYTFDHPFAFATSKGAGAPAAHRPQFMIRLAPRRGIDLVRNPTPDERMVMSAHRQYMEMLAKTGHLVLTGVSEDEAIDGIVLIEADSRDEAEGLLSNDPFVFSNLAQAQLRPFRTALARGGDHSHSIVAGGLELTSYTTRLTPRT